MKAAPPAATGAVAVGPWTIAMLLRNPEMMLLDTFEDPQFIHDLMRLTTDFCKLWGDAIAKTKIGLSFSEPTASISLVSPDNYREFIAPYHKELVDHFKAKKVGVTAHICGVTYPIFEDLIGCGFTTISFDLDQQSDPTLHVDQLERFVQVAKGRAVAIGNVDATMFEKATRQQIEGEVRPLHRHRGPAVGLHPVHVVRDPAAVESRDREVVHGRGPRPGPLRADLVEARASARKEKGRGDRHRALFDLSPASLGRYQRNGFFEGGTP